MKTLSIRLPELLAAEIEAEARERRTSRSEVIRERLRRAAKTNARPARPLQAIADLIGSVDGLPADLSARKKHYLAASGNDRKRHR